MGLPKVNIWTDGGQNGGNPGDGAAVAVLQFRNKIKVICKPLGHVTNNNAEAWAAAIAMQALGTTCSITLTTDSQYVENGIARIRRRSMLKTNVDAWQAFKEAFLRYNHKLYVQHTYGHGDDEMNNLADAWASHAAERQEPTNILYESVQDAFMDAPKMNPKKYRNIQRSKALKQRQKERRNG
jgi:ribonuclease HI